MGEDHILENFFDLNYKGFYVEVGCNHPIKFSNTFSFYCRGWHGIAIDANRKLINEFSAIRKNDICVSAAVSDSEQDVTYYEFNTDEINTIDESVLANWQKSYHIVSTSTQRTQTLNNILKDKLPPGTSIDLLSVDVEGHDLNVLKSIDLKLYKPTYIIIEMHDFDLSNPKSNSIFNHLVEASYEFIGYVSLNGYFRLK